MPMLGMDVQIVRQLATEMSTAADQMQQIGDRITARVQGTPWEGPDKQQFVGEWENRRSQLVAVANTLRDAAQRATANANEQEATSNR